MRNYLAAECYKVFRRKYFYLTLLVVLALEGVLLWGCWLSSTWGNAGMDFYSAATMVSVMLSIGAYATILTCDMVFSEQYKQNTLKNEVAYGLPRVRIYLGKLAVATLVSILAAAVMLALYVAGCWLLLPHNELDGVAMTLNGYVLAGAFPLWLGAQGITMACYFLVRNTTLAAFVSVGLLGVLPAILQGLGLLFHPVFETVRQIMPTVMLETLPNRAFQMDYVGMCWLVGVALLILSTAVGLTAFQKKEIR
ncbi:ABC transporter permease [Flavonifractor hominis]|uniref:ABC transporter permease n=1 Tax=Flavonifractor hominis TaxID=3133178 RepID=A0ABV1EQ26_9FIRM